MKLNLITICQVRTASANSTLTILVWRLFINAPTKTLLLLRVMFKHKRVGFPFLRERTRVGKGIVHLFFYNSFHIFPKQNFICIHLYFPK